MSETARDRSGHVAPDRRRQARLAAVQALYQVELGHLTPRSVVMEFLQHRLDEDNEGLRLGRIDRSLFGELVEGVSERRAELAAMIDGGLDAAWSFDRLETLLRIILVCGAYELAQRPAVPAQIVMDEYLDLAHAFFDDREPALVNGVLDRLARTLRPDEAEGRGQVGAAGAAS